MNKILILASLCFLSACQKNNFFDEKKIAVSGYVSNLSGIEIVVSKLLATEASYSLSNSQNIFFINGAKVTIYENEKKIVDLIFKENGIYVFNDTLTWKPTIGLKYKVKVLTSEGDVVESEEVIFPKAALISKISYKIDTLMEDESRIAATINMEIEKKQVDNNFYQLSYNPQSSKYKKFIGIDRDFSLDEDLEKKFPECPYLYVLNSNIFSDKCMEGNKYTQRKFFAGSSPDIVNSVKIDSFRLQLATISQSYYQFWDNLYRQGIVDTRFQEMPPSYTNIRNGIGCFYAKNESPRVFVVKP